MERALILANPHSRSAGAGVDAAAAELQKAGIDVLRPAWREGEPLSAAIERCGDKADFVVIAGGDGSLNAAAPALIDGIVRSATARDSGSGRAQDRGTWCGYT